MDLPRKRLFSCAADTDEEGVASLLTENSCDADDVLDGVQEEYQTHLVR